MAKRHWTDEELISRLYGLEAEDSHLHECQECALRWRKALAARARVMEAPEVSADYLAAQRREILRRMEEPAWGFNFGGLGPAAAVTMALLLLGILLLGPGPKPEPSLASSDTQFFSEVYSVVQNTEPVAFAPVRELFEEQQ